MVSFFASLDGRLASAWTSEAKFRGDSDSVGRVPFRRLSPPFLVFRQCSRTPRRSTGLLNTLSTLCTTGSVCEGTKSVSMDLGSPVLR